MDEKKLVMKFLKTIKGVNQKEEEMLEYWEDYKKYELKRDTPVIIAGPSNHYGILDYKKAVLEECPKWKRYSLKRKMKLSWKKMGRIYFDGDFYKLMYLIDTLPMLESKEYEIGKAVSGDVTALCFKIDNQYCLSFGNLVHIPYEVKPDGVWFIDEIYDEDTDDWTEVTREFVKWNRDGVAIREQNDRSRGMKDYLYDKKYWFEEIEEFGGFLMI